MWMFGLHRKGRTLSTGRKQTKSDTPIWLSPVASPNNDVDDDEDPISDNEELDGESLSPTSLEMFGQYDRRPHQLQEFSRAEFSRAPAILNNMVAAGAVCKYNVWKVF
jgi:hypothetical protein